MSCLFINKSIGQGLHGWGGGGRGLDPCLHPAPLIQTTLEGKELLDLIEGNQLNMAVFFSYFVKSDLSSVFYFTRVHWTSHLFQGTRKTRQRWIGHPVVKD